MLWSLYHEPAVSARTRRLLPRVLADQKRACAALDDHRGARRRAYQSSPALCAGLDHGGRCAAAEAVAGGACLAVGWHSRWCCRGRLRGREPWDQRFPAQSAGLFCACAPPRADRPRTETWPDAEKAELSKLIGLRAKPALCLCGSMPFGLASAPIRNVSSPTTPPHRVRISTRRS